MDVTGDACSQLKELFKEMLFVPLETDLREDELLRLVELIDSTE